MNRAGSEPAYLARCLNKDATISRPAIEETADVQFDANYVLQCYPNKESAENQILLLFPDKPTPITSPVRNYWLCTYVDYVPA
jgi:hypothetical protein